MNERDYMGQVAALGCLLCAWISGVPGTPALVHHVRTGTGKMRASDYDTVPLCDCHHDTHPGSLHVLGVKVFWKVYGISELQLLAVTQMALAKFLPAEHEPPIFDAYAIATPAQLQTLLRLVTRPPDQADEYVSLEESF